MTASTLLQEQFAEVLLRYRRHALPLTSAISELTRLARRPQILEDIELQSLLSRIDHAHRTRTLKTHDTGRWAGAPTGRAISELCGVAKIKVRPIRDAYYTLYLGLSSFDADEPAPLLTLTGYGPTRPDETCDRHPVLPDRHAERSPARP